MTREAEKKGGAISCEGVPKNSNMVASVGMFPDSSTNTISDYDMYVIISCLPFLAKAKMFWNMIGRADATGVACAIFYRGLESLYSAPDDAIPGETTVDDKVSHFWNQALVKLTNYIRFYKLFASLCRRISRTALHTPDLDSPIPSASQRSSPN